MNFSVTAESEPFIFVHGIKGSVLESEHGETYWVNLMQSLSLSTPNLALPLDKSQSSNVKLIPKEILSSVRIIPYLLDKKVYAPWLESASQFSGKDFYPFAYDWRQDNIDSLSKLRAFTKEIKSKYPNKKIHIVGHSMGGLLTLALVNEDPSLFDSVVLASSPIQGGISFLEDLQIGTSTGLNSKILSPEILATFPSVYTFFPLKVTTQMLEENGETANIDFYSAESWRANKIGIFSKSLTIEKENVYFEFLKNTLPSAKKFRLMLSYKKIFYPRILIVNSNKFTTLVTIKKQKGIWDFNISPKEMGDDRVTDKNSLPEKNIPFTTIQSDFEHSAILNDPKIIRAIEEFQKKGIE